MKSIIIREFKRNKTSFVIYCLLTIAITWMYVALFPSIASQSKQLDQLLKTFPDSIMKAFGFDKSGFNSVEKFLSTELMTIFWPIIAIVLCLSRAGATLAGDIENKTIGLELSLPIKRINIYVAKFIGSFVSVFLYVSISIFSMIPLCLLHSIDISASKVFKVFIICLLFATALLSASMMFSSIFSEKGKVFFSVGGILIISYVINVFALLSDSYSWLKLLSVFHYFDATKTLSKGLLSTTSIIFFIIVIIISLPIGAIQFNKRDISI